MEKYPEMIELLRGDETNLHREGHCYDLRVPIAHPGTYHIICNVDGRRVLGSPFVMLISQDPDLVAQQAAREQEKATLLNVERMQEMEQKLDERASAEGTKIEQSAKQEKQAQTRIRALERLRKTQNELRQKVKREKTTKEKRVGGGFLVKFDARPPPKRRIETSA